MPGPTGYSILSYGDMVRCEPRMPAYVRALRQAVSPGCTVIDIGAGPGVFSLLACQYGAGRVIAIEPDDSVELLRQLARDNGCEDRITIVQGLSTDYEPPARADVIVSDIRGGLPYFEAHIATIADARARLLAPSGTLIPSRDTIRLALAQSGDQHASSEEPWLRNKVGLDLSAGHRFAANSWRKVNFDAPALLSSPVDLAVLDYSVVTDPDLSATAGVEVSRAGVLHGLLLWFDTELAPGAGYSNAPGQPPLVYGQTFLPLEGAIDVAPGDRVEAEITASLVDGSYVWSWNGRFFRSDGAPAASFRHSTFLGKVISPQSLRTRAAGFAPPARAAHDIDRLCLSLIDGQRTLAEIAARLCSDYPAQFPDSTKALNHVVELTNRYR